MPARASSRAAHRPAPPAPTMRAWYSWTTGPRAPESAPAISRGPPSADDRGAGEGHDHQRAQDEQHRGQGVEEAQDGGPGPTAQVVLGDRAHAQERMEQDEHQQEPVEGPPEELVPALVGDELGRLTGRVEQEVEDAEVGQGEDEEPQAAEAHEVPDRGLKAVTLRPGPTGAGHDSHARLPTRPRWA